MVEDCPTCGLHFERVEGHWIGAIGINTIVSFGALLITIVALLVAILLFAVFSSRAFCKTLCPIGALLAEQFSGRGQGIDTTLVHTWQGHAWATLLFLILAAAYVVAVYMRERTDGRVLLKTALAAAWRASILPPFRRMKWGLSARFCSTSTTP